MEIAVSNIAWTSSDDKSMNKYLKCSGFKGIEIAPTRIFHDTPYQKLVSAKEWAEHLFAEYNLIIPSMQSIWYGRVEKLFGSESERKVLLDYTKKAIDFAEAIGCRNLVFGCPKNRIMNNKDDWEFGVEFFRELATYAGEHGTVIGMEANPEIYGTNYINTTNEALDLLTEVNSPYFRLNLDLGTMIQNKENPAILQEKVHYISHVHVSEPFLRPIEKRDIHAQVAAILREEKYKGFVSIEMGKVDDMTTLYRAMDYVREVFGTNE